MKQFLFSILSVIICLTASAQISITENEMPDAPFLGQGDTIRFSTAPATTAGIDVTQTGANHTWDFSFLQPNGQGVNQYKNSTTTLYSFLGAGFNAIGLKQPDISIPLGVTTIALTDAYEFYNKTTNVFEAKATGYTVSGIPLGSTYSNTDKIYQFPLNYADVDTDDFHYTLSISNVPGISISITYTRAGKRVNEVDGYGNITTPFGTFNCIRVKSTITETDSIDVGFGFAIPVPNNRIEYKWLANGIKIPVLEIDQNVVLGVATTSSIKYRDIYRNLAPTADFVADNTTPLRWQPVTFTNQTTSASSGNMTYRWTITPDSMFTFVNNTSRNSANPVVNFDVDTVFDVQLKATNSSGADSIIKQQYIKVGSQIADVKGQPTNHSILIFPNPTQGKLFVSGIVNITNIKSIKTIDVSGKEINLAFETNQNNIFIDTNTLTKGYYVLHICCNDSVHTKGFAKTE
jgi:Secretion system C-terminal sorting domain